MKKSVILPESGWLHEMNLKFGFELGIHQLLILFEFGIVILNYHQMCSQNWNLSEQMKIRFEFEFERKISFQFQICILRKFIEFELALWS